jgi:SnoaL-like domain
VSSDDDIALLRETYRILNEEGRLETDLFADDFLLEQSPQMPGTRGEFHGPRGAQASWRELLDGFDATRFEPQGFEPYRDWLIVPVSWWGTARGVEQRIDIIHIWRMSNGKALRLRVLGSDADPRAEVDKLSQ